MKNLLNIPEVFNFYEKLVGDRKYKKFISKHFLEISSNHSVLDVGCGPGNLIPFLPENIDYTGVDISKKYINYAKKKYKDKSFICSSATEISIQDKKFDSIIVDSVFMSLSDESAKIVTKITHSLLKPNGTLFLMDGCYVDNGNFWANLLLSQERGNNIRREQNYREILSNFFLEIHSEIHTNLYSIPYTKILLKAKNPISF